MLILKSFVGHFLAQNLRISRVALQQFLAEYALIEDTSNIPTFESFEKQALDKLGGPNINLTVDYDDTELPDGSVAFHLIRGPIMYSADPWGFFFSTKRFRDNMIRAENNPQISGHFFLVNSGGGDAYYLDVAAQAMRDLQKPKLGLIERMAGSAGWYLIMNAGEVYAQTQNEIVGSIGTMVSGLDLIPYFEKLGAKWIEEYASLSDRKNKKTNGLLNDDKKEKEKFIKEELDPLAQQFVDAVKEARPDTRNLPADGDKEHPVFRGETYRSQTSLDEGLGLIDGIMLMEEAVQKIAKMAQEYREKQDKVTNSLKLIS